MMASAGQIQKGFCFERPQLNRGGQQPSPNRKTRDLDMSAEVCLSRNTFGPGGQPNASFFNPWKEVPHKGNLFILEDALVALVWPVCSCLTTALAIRTVPVTWCRNEESERERKWVHRLRQQAVYIRNRMHITLSSWAKIRLVQK